MAVEAPPHCPYSTESDHVFELPTASTASQLDQHCPHITESSRHSTNSKSTWHTREHLLPPSHYHHITESKTATPAMSSSPVMSEWQCLYCGQVQQRRSARSVESEDESPCEGHGEYLSDWKAYSKDNQASALHNLYHSSRITCRRA